MKSNDRRLYTWLKRIAVPRPGGSRNETEIVNLVKKELIEAGGKPKVERFKILTSDNHSGSLEVIEPFKAEVPCTVMGLSGSTPEGGITAPFKFMEYAVEHLVDEATDCILMYHRSSGKPELFKKYKKNGVKALVRIAQPETGPSNVSLTEFIVHKYGRVPTIMIPYDSAVELIQKNASLVHVTVNQNERECYSRNLVLKITGKRHPEEEILIGSHIDSVPGTQGASDNAAGSVMNLELARHFLANPPDRTLRFIWFGSEELGLNGSMAYVRRHWKELDRARLMLNLDVGGGTVATNEAFVIGPDTLWKYVEVMGKEFGMHFSQVSNDGKNLSSDHVSFGYAGIPTLCLERNGGHTAFVHTPKDSIEYLDGERLKQIVDFSGKFLTRVDSSKCFPFEREVKKEHKEDITAFLTDFIGINPKKYLEN